MSHPVVSKEEWLAARRDLLVKEKELTRARDRLNEARRALPWEEVTKDYIFDAPSGPKSLKELFGTCSQLIVYHFMLAPDWEEGCVGCSFFADHVDGALIHLKHGDAGFVAVSRAPLEKIESYRNRMGWKFPGFRPKAAISTTIIRPRSATRTWPKVKSPIITVTWRPMAT